MSVTHWLALLGSVQCRKVRPQDRVDSFNQGDQHVVRMPNYDVNTYQILGKWYWKITQSPDASVGPRTIIFDSLGEDRAGYATHDEALKAGMTRKQALLTGRP
jgi:hypothetical protein